VLVEGIVHVADDGADEPPDGAPVFDGVDELIAGLDEIAVRVLDLDDWEAARKFVDEHIPIEGGDERGMYSQEEIDHAIARLREEWTDDRLRELTPLAPYLKEKLASTRREAVRQGYAADGGLNR
jgi:hypothetical protein